MHYKSMTTHLPTVCHRIGHSSLSSHNATVTLLFQASATHSSPPSPLHSSRQAALQERPAAAGSPDPGSRQQHALTIRAGGGSAAYFSVLSTGFLAKKNQSGYGSFNYLNEVK